MLPQFVEQLYAHIKQVITKPIAITDKQGRVYNNLCDFPEKKLFVLKDKLRADQYVLAIEGEDKLQAIPVYYQTTFYALVVVEVQAEDVQMIKIITSLAELLVEQFIGAHKPRPDAVDLLLVRMAYKPSTIDAEEIEHQMAALGYRTDVQRSAIAIELKGFWDNYLQTVGQPLGEKDDLIAAKKSDIQQSFNNFFSKNPDNLVGYIGNDLFLILKDLRETDYDSFCQLLTKHFSAITDSLRNVYIKEITVGIGSPSRNSQGLLESIGQSLQVLKVGQKLVGVNQAHRLETLGVLPLLLSGGDAQKRAYASSIFQTINDSELSETLSAFMENNLNLTQTAEALKVHRNTVIYRLDKLTEKLGKDPRRFDDAVSLYLAILFRRVLN